MSEQSEALDLADRIVELYSSQGVTAMAATVLRRQHSRIEADEALMRQAFSVLLFSHPNPAVQEEKQRVSKALRARLETSNAS